jgi:hypothetical protein
MGEERIETGSKRRFLFAGLRHGQQQRIAQDRAIGGAHFSGGTHRIDTFGRRNPDTGAPRRPKEAMQRVAHG